MNYRQLKLLITLLVTLAPIITLTFSSCSMDDIEPVDFKAEKTTGTDYVGNLMMDVGEHAGMEYAAGGSGAVTRRLIFTYYGINCDSLAYNYSQVRASLENGQPVLSSARDATYGGHAWVIDGYQDDLSTTDNPYK